MASDLMSNERMLFVLVFISVFFFFFRFICVCVYVCLVGMCIPEKVDFWIMKNDLFILLVDIQMIESRKNVNISSKQSR